MTTISDPITLPAEMQTPSAPPAWLNLDAIVTQAQLDEIAAVRDELLALIPGAMQLAGRIDKAIFCLERFEGADDIDMLPLLQRLTGLDVVEDLTTMLGELVGSPHGYPGPGQLAKLAGRWEPVFPGLTDAVERWTAERPSQHAEVSA